MRTDVGRAIAQLEPIQRELLWLAYAQGVSHDAIAEILGLRSMYFAVSGMIEWFEYLHYGLSVVLILIGAKMLVSHYVEVPTAVALGTVAGVIAVSVVASVVWPQKE